MPPVAISRINTSLYSSFHRAVVAGQRSNLVSSSGYRVRPLLYSTSLSSETSLFLPLHYQKRKSMAASGSKAFSGDVSVDGLISSCGNPVDFTKPSAVFFEDRSRRIPQRASLRLKRPEPSNTLLFCSYSTYEAVWKNENSLKPVASRSRSSRIVPFAQYSGGPIHDVSLEGNSHDRLLANSAASAGQDNVGNRVLRLLSGSCSLPHPDKEEKGGEDAHFICEDEQVIGVADGVGGWADVGVDAGLFSRELMSNSVNAIKEESNGPINPARVLEKAHAGTKARGSSTACIIALTEEGLDAINLGDSGFIVIRDGSTVFRSPTQQHGFNFTYQLESGNTGDLPSSGEVFRIPVVPGDVIVAGTDGLFDNLYNNEITAVVVDAVRAGSTPQATAQKIAALARQRALDRKRQTPFATAAQEAGFRYHGGKLDDITVVVSFVTATSTSS